MNDPIPLFAAPASAPAPVSAVVPTPVSVPAPFSAPTPLPQHFVRHILFCTNQRANGESCCADHPAEAAFAHCKEQVRQAGLNGPGKVRVSKAGCLGRCEAGPVAVVYPEGVWYSYVDLSDVDEIVSSHLTHGQPVARLLVPADPQGAVA